MRLKELDHTRAVGIIAVVAIHSAIFFRYYNPQSLKQYYLYHQVTSFAVPLFLLVSAVSLSLKKDFNYVDFLIGRLKYIGVPFLIWSLIYLLLQGKLIFSHQLILTIIYGNAKFHLYFMALIFQFYLLFPLFKFVAKKMSIYLFIPFFFLQYWLPAKVSSFPIATDLRGAFFIHWFLIFLIGCYLGVNYRTFKNLVQKYIGLVVAALGVVVTYKLADYYYHVFYIKKYSFWMYPQSTTLDNYLYTVLVFALILKISPLIKNRFVLFISDKLSNNSFAVYLNHALTITLFNNAIASGKPSINGGKVLGIFIFTLFIGVVFSELMKRIPFGYLLTGHKR